MDMNYLFDRCHSTYRQNREVWERSLAAYSGGREYISRALIKHVSEIDLEYAERLERAYYFNYPRKIASLITQYIFASDPDREGADTLLCEDVSRDGMRINELMRQASTMVNVFGSAWLVVEMPGFNGFVDMANGTIYLDLFANGFFDPRLVAEFAITELHGQYYRMQPQIRQ